MIVSCDLPRHALLIHFGSRFRRHWPRVTEFDEGIEIAFDETETQPRLVAIHFRRHKFKLPYTYSDPYSLNNLYFEYWRENQYACFHLEFRPQHCEQIELVEGLSILLSHPHRAIRPSLVPVDERPTLYGLRLNTRAFEVEYHANELIFELGSDNLKDVGVTLFCESSSNTHRGT